MEPPYSRNTTDIGGSDQENFDWGAQSHQGDYGASVGASSNHRGAHTPCSPLVDPPVTLGRNKK